MTALNALQFEREVADLYRALGSNVRHDVAVAGNQIDVLVTEETSPGSPLTRIVECKAYSSPVGPEPVRSFAAISSFLRERRLADLATIVAASGFSQYAREMAQEFSIELLEIADLRARVTRATHAPAPDKRPPLSHTPAVSTGEQPFAFVALPFNPKFDDVYVYGISSAAERAKVSVERADDVLESVEIISYAKSRIAACDILIADTTESNPNVFYELGYADGLQKGVLLIAQADAELPFDIRGRRHLLYQNIKDLETRLVPFLRKAALIANAGP